MKIPAGVKCFGDQNYRAKKCPSEMAEQITFFNWLRREHPQCAATAMHIKNEGKKSICVAMKDAAAGLNTGASDVVIIARTPFVCELKKADHTQSRISEKQVLFLQNSEKAGAFACIALGAAGAKEAFLQWLKIKVD